MKTPFDSTDPLLQILAEEAADLPLKAANEARKSRSLEAKRRRQIAIAVSVLFCAMCVWQFFPQGQVGKDPVAIQTPADAPIAVPEPASLEPSLQPMPHVPEPSDPPSPQSHEVAIARTQEQAMNEPLLLPEGLTEEQASVVMAARDLPLLLVRDTTGKVARIHVIER